MPTDLHDLARRLVALGYDMDDDGIRILYRCPAISDVVAGAVQCAENSHDIDDIIKGGVPGRPVEVIGPDLSHDGTLGVLLGAMGWPTVNLYQIDDEWRARLCDEEFLSIGVLVQTLGPTRKHALAAAIVALAESRGRVVP